MDDRIKTSPDFILLRRYDYSLEKLTKRYPDGVPPKLAAQALGITEQEEEELYQSAVKKLREKMKA
jgi:hypothetical protein